MSYSSPSVHDLHHSTPSTARPEPGTALDVTVPQTATISPETTTFNSTKIPDMASTGPGMSTMLLSFGIITVIGLAVAMRTEGSSKLPFLVQGRASLIQPSEEPTAKFHCRPQEEFFQKPLRKPGNSQKFPRAASSVCSSQDKAVEAQSLLFFPAQADRGSVYQEEEEVGEAAAPAHAHVQLRPHRGTG
ncbi:uncharacterized protein C3orf18 homolog isoform X1 [Melospiza melodia melodia]|uniref:uncharacterized protein C3orf18 homolog isoform X1 n=1 Tax=Melospiza melodia melodia TaxID=1914991 RepID=UPI002FD412C6